MMNKYFLLVLLCFFIFIPAQKAHPREFQPIKAANGIVVTADKFAAQIGLSVLERGGNAVDASVAAAFALAVTYPTAGNIGGGGFMIIRTADNNVFALDYREKAPLKASRDMYLDQNGEVIKDANTIGYLAAGVPGTVYGLWQAHKKFGRLKWKSLLEPAIDLAEKGFYLDEYNANGLNAATDDFNRFESSKKIFTRDGCAYKTNDKLIQKDLAQTLKRIAKKGIDGFYSGITAELIEKDMLKNGGLITKEDLKAYNSKWRQPIKIQYRGYDIYSMSPPSSGGILLAEILNCLEKFNLKTLGHNSSDLINLWVEIERQAYADRAKYMGDTDFIDMPIIKLISKDYASVVCSNLNYYKAGCSDSAGVNDRWINESEQTTHFCVIDKWGNAVSNTYTLNSSYGSRAVAEGTGILLNNEMDDFSIKPGYPNRYGLIGCETNSIQPGKRMLSSMTPSIVTKNDSLFLVIGSPGGSTIITTVAQIISNVIDHQMNIRQAIEAPRFHHQWKPDVVYLEENRFNRDTINNVKNKNYKIHFRSSIGNAQGILFLGKEKLFTGWSDPRGNGQVSGY
jgi:gamma-glutamyltranspeptidase/glutathione hydrolase